MFDAIIFDLDGTLIDSEAVSLAAGLEVFGPYSSGFTTAFFHSLIGTDDDTARRLITARLPEGIPYEEVHGVWRRMIRARFIAEGVPLKPGAKATLAALSAKGLPLAIATSSLAASAEFKLTRAEIACYFNAVVVRESIAAPKPAPDAYLEAARQLNVDPKRCLAFEDSALGATAAFAAGMQVYQIPDVVPAPADAPWQVASSLSEACTRLGLLP